MAVDGLSAPDGVAHRSPGLLCHYLLPGVSSLEGEGILRLAAGIADLSNGGVHLSGLSPVLPVLGVGVAAHVPAHISIWGTGRKEYSGNEVPHFHHSGQRIYAGGHPGRVRHPRTWAPSTWWSYPKSGIDAAQSRHCPRQRCLLVLCIVAFAIKLPIWPVHTWLPDAHTDAPTAVSVMLAGVLLKMGGYGLIRVSVGMFHGLGPMRRPFHGRWRCLAVISVLYGAVVTLRQTDLKSVLSPTAASATWDWCCWG